MMILPPDRARPSLWPDGDVFISDRPANQQARLAAYIPYPRQELFHARGAEFRERLLMAANQVGKTLAGGAELAIHLTGRYPAWWRGRRFARPIRAWAGSETVEVTRDTVQRILIGEPKDESQWGSGMIPGAAIVDRARRTGKADALDSVVVKHASGGHSTLGFKSYDQGRQKWQGETLDAVWFDEEPPHDIYMEGLTRTNATEGLVWLTFTPLLGVSEVVHGFLGDDTRSVTRMTIDDALHFSEAQRAAIIAAYPEHEREARTKGRPALGSGRVFPVSEESITVAPFEIPATFARIIGLDFGWEHPFAAVSLAHDRDADVIYVTQSFGMSQATPIEHAAALRDWGTWIPCAWPHDGLQHDKGSGQQLAALYREQGLNLLPEHATHEDGGTGVEAGVIEMLARMRTGRLKVFAGLTDWFDEFRLYHRKNGVIVKQRDDRLSATRYGMMMRRWAECEAGREPVRRRRRRVVRSSGWMGM